MWCGLLCGGGGVCVLIWGSLAVLVMGVGVGVGVGMGGECFMFHDEGFWDSISQLEGVGVRGLKD